MMRDFYDRQEDAQIRSEWLLVMMITAAVVTTVVFAVAASLITVLLSMGYMWLIVGTHQPADYFWQTFVERMALFGPATAVVVIATTLYRCWQLAEGGGRTLARELRGTRISEITSDPNEKMIVNVVEELAIAAGIAAPAIYVLKDDRTINAFAAGKEPKDYVIGVTRGAIDRLSRNQLQAVMAHEFSHIINGDTRLNLRLIGMLAGVQVMARIAAFLFNMGAGKTSGAKSGLGSGDLRGQIIAIVLGTLVYPIGALGEFTARLVKLAVNRQREFLADASAVQLTRDPVALCEALHLIAFGGSRVGNPNASLVSHHIFRRCLASLARSARYASTDYRADSPTRSRGTGGPAGGGRGCSMATRDR